MNVLHFQQVAKELNIHIRQVEAVAKLLSEDATVPFIARYRKEATGSLDEVIITAIRDRLAQLEELDKRREAILKSLSEREILTDELKEKIEASETMTELEDIYLPYRPKKRTRATIAKEKGLEPLAQVIFEQADGNVAAEAEKFIDEEKGVTSTDDALQGARDIIAEWINEDAKAREQVRNYFLNEAVITSKVVKGKDEEGVKYKDYFEWSEPASKSPSHRILAMFRGENESILRLDVTPEEDGAIIILDKQFIKANNEAAEQVKLAVRDSYKRLLSLSMETELRITLKEKADLEAVNVFAENLKQLLMAPPLGNKNVMAIDPGFRTGCKVVFLDKQGKLLFNETIYPHTGEQRRIDSGEVLQKLAVKYKTEIIAVGNGTAGRETESFVREIFKSEIPVIMVNESGASIYSASDVAREEFPDYDVTVRGSVSIGRRLMDPLAELVKIDPKSIGVGQYQHDVNQPLLRGKLDDVVISCVNGVGVELNTASKQLLTYVSGLGPKLAQGIVEYRNENGPFKSRSEIKKVPRLGAKAFEQAAGFLRVRESKNPLDASAVHPESYYIVEQMAKDLGCTVAELISDKGKQSEIDLKKYVTDTVGMPTLEDIKAELAKPGRDPRQEFEIFKFQEGVDKIEDLKPGMKLPGIVTNLTAFGAFVDIGVHQDGLVHISQITDRYIKNPAEVLKVHQKVNVTVVEVDIPRKRIQLTMKEPGAKPPPAKNKNENRGGKEDKKKEEAANLNKLLEKFGRK